EQERIRRVVERDGATEAQVRARMQHQTDDRARLAVAGSVITNDNRAMVIPQVLAVHHKLMNLARA
ncbi:MAG TPA: dephospho-CoA kinase, partial [Flavobacteriales bacterium]|nr:dephospho-CoA kinase [Flavobacteriales bacterium]